MIKSFVWKETAILFLGLFIGLLAGTSLLSRATPKPARVPDVLRAHRFELMDENGTARGILGFSSNGGTYICLNDKAGKLQVLLNTTPEHMEITPHIPLGGTTNVLTRQTTSLSLYDEQGRTRVLLNAEGGSFPQPGETEQGETRLSLFNPSGIMNINLTTKASGEARLEFGHETGKNSDALNIYRYAVLRSSLKDGVTLRLSGQGMAWYGKQGEGEAYLKLEGKNDLLELPTHSKGTTKP